jgi:poly(3-hydroxybutyrate) depolymerase
VSSRRSLSRNGGGDSHAIANMVAHALATYGVDRDRVYLTGGSSGAMMGNVMAAAYPDLFKAVSVYSGVAAGCFVSSSGGVAAWYVELVLIFSPREVPVTLSRERKALVPRLLPRLLPIPRSGKK